MGRGGVQGEVAAVTGTTMQVQDTDSQTAVTWSDSTTFQRTSTADASAASVGTCVVVLGGTDAAATSVAVSDPVDGECTGGLGFGGSGGFGGFSGQGPAGEMPDGMPTDMPDGMPTDLPTDMPDGMPTDMPSGAAGAGFDLTVGLVTATADGSLTVETTDQDGATSSATVTVDAATTWTRTAAADATAVAVGLCASAQGESDDSGGMTATSVTLSDPTDEGCATRPAGGRFDG
jgi:hypothetical protein